MSPPEPPPLVQKLTPLETYVKVNDTINDVGVKKTENHYQMKNAPSTSMSSSQSSSYDSTNSGPQDSVNGSDSFVSSESESVNAAVFPITTVTKVVEVSSKANNSPLVRPITTASTPSVPITVLPLQERKNTTESDDEEEEEEQYEMDDKE